MKEASKQEQWTPRLMTCSNKCQLSSSLPFKITLKNTPIKKNNTQGKLKERRLRETVRSGSSGEAGVRA